MTLSRELMVLVLAILRGDCCKGGRAAAKLASRRIGSREIMAAFLLALDGIEDGILPFWGGDEVEVKSCHVCHSKLYALPIK